MNRQKTSFVVQLEMQAGKPILCTSKNHDYVAHVKDNFLVLVKCE